MKPVEITNSLNSLKAKSQNLHVKAQTINMANGKLITSGGGPYPGIIAGIEEIISTGANLTSDMQGSPQLEGSDATAVADAFKEFVHVHQVLLHLLTSKAGLFKSGQPVADVLRQEKDILDAVALGLINIDNSKQSELKTQQTALNSTLRAAIRAHSQS